jgi:hypothetical protein
MSDRELELTLRELGRRVAFPPDPDIARAVALRLKEGARPAPWFARRAPALAFAVVVLVAVAASLLVPGVRTAVADFLGIGGVRIEVGPSPTPPGEVGRDLFLGDAATLAQARDRAGFELGVPAALGAPDEVFIEEVSDHHRIALLWEPRKGLPEAEETGVGALLVEFPGGVGEYAGKQVEADLVEEVSVNGAPGFWVREEHFFFYTDPEGEAIDDSIRLAANTLIWERNGVGYRLETALGRGAALRIAESIP